MNERQIVLDTETTGLDPAQGHRVIEIGCVELLERRASGRTFHCYLNPGRPVDEGARAVHGIGDEFLADKPRFAEVVDEFLAFIDGAELIIHNAAFDVGFLDAELARLSGYGNLLARCTVEDSLLLARQRFPGQRNSLDALCKRLGVDNSHRQLHGALLDAQILAEVYLALTSGQEEIGFGHAQAEPAAGPVALPSYATVFGERPRIAVAADEEQAHQGRLATLRKKAGRALWDELASA